MKNFIDLKDVEVNNMKKKELLEANGGYPFDVPLKGTDSIKDILEDIFGGGMTGYAPPSRF